MTRERILYTLPSGGVVVCCPAENCIQALMHGPTGPWHPWFSEPWWFWIVQFNRMLASGVEASVAYRFARSMTKGGLSRREAVALIAARDCEPHGEAVEIIDVMELPDNRTHRDAWRRSKNGGPIWIDEEKAREIDELRMWNAYYAKT